MSEEFEIGSMWERIDEGDWSTKTGHVRILTEVDDDSVRWDDGSYSFKVALEPGRKVWRRLPSSQPEKVEPRVGQRWSRDMDGAICELTSRDETNPGYWNGKTIAPDWGSIPNAWWLEEKDGTLPGMTLISTGEAEKPAVCWWGSNDGKTWEKSAANPTGHTWFKHTHHGESPPQFAPAATIAVHGLNGPAHDALIAARMEAKNAEWAERHKAAIQAQWEAQKREPAYQPHWQRTGVQTYSRRVPR